MTTKKEKTTSKIILFSLIWLVMLGYILRDLIAVNFEVLLLIMLVFSLWVIWGSHINTKTTKNVSLLIWSWLIVFYWFIALVILFYHDGLEGRSGNTMNVVHSVLVFVAMGWALYKLKPTIDYLWISVGIGSFFILFLSFLEFAAVDFNLVGRLGDFYGNPIGFGILANTFLIILVGALPWAFFKNKIIFGAYLIMGIMLLTAVIFSQTRTAWLGLPEAFLAWGIYYYFLYKKNHPQFNSRIMLKLSVVALIFVGLFFSSSNVITKRVGEVFSGANDYITGKSFQSSSGQRLLMYEAGITGISNHLWLGIGENDFKVFMKSETQRIAYTRFNQEFDGFDYSHIHNQFLMALITKGLFGFMSVLLLFIFLFFYFLKGMKTADITDKPVWIAGFVFSLAEFMSFMPESPLQRSVYSSHFFLITTLFIVFSLLITRKSSHLIPSKSSL